MLNVKLAIGHGLSKSKVKDLIALHVAMDVMVQHLNLRCDEHAIPPRARKTLGRYVRRLEYQMQDIWGFDRDKHKHTHWIRFDCLRDNPPTWYEKMSPPVDTREDS